MWQLIKIDRSAVKFLFVGVGNTIFGLSVIFFSKWLLGMGDVIANAFGYANGFLLSFFLNKSWTFRYRGSTWVALLKFLMVSGIAYMANLVTVLVSINNLGMNSYFSQSLGIIPYTFIGYLGSRFFAFKKI